MKKIWLLLIIVGISSLGAFWLTQKKGKKEAPYQGLQTGDIVFQDTGGYQGAAVRAATNSDYTHCGVVFEANETPYVLEAVQPVSVTTLELWRTRSKIFHALRLKDQSKLHPKSVSKALEWGQRQLGKDYDLLFQWDDDDLYCSELVWKIYQRATGIELSQPKSFQSYFLDDPAVQKVIEDRYGDLSALPRDEPVVAPSDLAESPFLIEVPRGQRH